MDLFYSLTLGGEGPVRALSEGPGISVTHRLCSPRTFLVCTLINPSVQDKARQLVIPLRVLFLAERWHTDVLFVRITEPTMCAHLCTDLTLNKTCCKPWKPDSKMET